MSFKPYDVGNVPAPLVSAKKASGTVIEKNKFVTLDGAWLIIEATAASTKLGYTTTGAKDGETEMLIVDTNKQSMLFKGVSNAPIADTDKGLTYDLILSGSDQQLDLGNQVTNVLKVESTDKNYAGETTVFVSIAAPL